jgi:hypothetical protein
LLNNSKLQFGIADSIYNVSEVLHINSKNNSLNSKSKATSVTDIGEMDFALINNRFRAEAYYNACSICLSEYANSLGNTDLCSTSFDWSKFKFLELCSNYRPVCLDIISCQNTGDGRCLQLKDSCLDTVEKFCILFSNEYLLNHFEILSSDLAFDPSKLSLYKKDLIGMCTKNKNEFSEFNVIVFDLVDGCGLLVHDILKDIRFILQTTCFATTDSTSECKLNRIIIIFFYVLNKYSLRSSTAATSAYS